VNILHEIRKRKANWNGHILRRNCLLKQLIEGKIKGEMEVIRRRGRRRKKLLDDLKDRRGYSHLKEEALDRTMWRNRFRWGFGPVVRQTTEWMNEFHTRLLNQYFASHHFTTHIYTLPIAPRFHPFPTLHFTTLPITSLHFLTLLDDFHFTSLHFTTFHYTFKWFPAHFTFL
jgi:hypothetical protein